MAIVTTAKIEVGRHGALYDFTSRMLTFSTELVVDWAKCGAAKATVVLKNLDGALTPGAGGTYTTLDWFTQSLWIYLKSDNGTSNEEVVAFAGLVNDIRFDDDGTSSTVTISAVDAISKLGQNTTLTKSAYTAADMGDDAMDPLRNIPGGFIWPKLTDNVNTNVAELYLWDYGATTRTTGLATGTSVTVQGARSYLEQTVLPGGPAVMWPVGIKTTNVTLAGTTDWEYALIMVGFKRAAGKKVTLKFDDYRNSITGGELPFVSIEVGYETDELVNQTSINRPGGTAQVGNNTTSQGKYGVKAVTYTNVQAPTNNRSENIGDRIRTRFATPTFEPLSLTTKASTINRYASNDAYNEWATVLSMGEAPYQQADIVWTATGGSSQTKTRSIRGRRIVGNPADITVTVYFTEKETAF